MVINYLLIGMILQVVGLPLISNYCGAPCRSHQPRLMLSPIKIPIAWLWIPNFQTASLSETNIAPEKMGIPSKDLKVVFQPSICRGFGLLVYMSLFQPWHFHDQVAESAGNIFPATIFQNVPNLFLVEIASKPWHIFPATIYQNVPNYSW